MESWETVSYECVGFITADKCRRRILVVYRVSYIRMCIVALLFVVVHVVIHNGE